MMHDGGWFGMGWGGYWLVPTLIVVLAILAWGIFARRRSRDDH
jgi:hypothetical protein